MKSLWHLGNSKQQQSILKEHQLHLQTHKKLLIAIFLFSLIYFLVDAVVCLHVNPDISYLTLILACSFQLVKLLLFFFYMRITTQNPDNKHSFFLEILFVFIFCASTILTWNLQIDLDPSRIYIIGIETGWTFLYVHTLFGRWPWKAIIYVSAPLYGIYKMVMASQELSPGVCQAILQLALVIVSALIEESRKKQNVLETVSLEKTGQTLKNILNSLPDNIAILNLDGDIRFYNDFFGISFKLTDNVSSELLFSQICQVKPRERHLNLQKIQEKYNFVRPTRKTIKRPNVNLSPTSRQSFAKAADSSSNTLMQYLTEELESANNKGTSVANTKKDKASLRRARSARFSQLPPLKTLTEFFSSINYFRDLQEVLDFMCLNVAIIRSYTEKERSFFIFDGKYKTSEGLNKSFEIKISLSNFDNEESFILILRDTTHRDIIVTLEDHNNFKDSVLSSLSHELRTPLNANLNLLQLAIHAYSKVTKNLSLKFPSYNGISEENYGTLIASETTLAKMDFKDSYLVPAHKSGKLLESLINDIVDYSMLLARKFAINVKQKYLNKSIEKILYMCEFQAQRKNLELRVNISPEINFKVGTDHKRLRQIVTNLINNAIKFTSKGFVSLDIEPYCDNSQLIQFTVKDSGIGIDKAGLERMTTILDAGNFLDKLNQESSGVGMGLVISHLLAKEIGPTAQRMSGIKIESTRNKGSKFRFVIENFVNGPPSPESKILDGTNLLHMQKEKARSDARKGTLLLANIRGDSRKSTLFFGSSTETFPSRGDNKLKINNNVSSITDRRDQTDDHVIIPISDINDRDIDEENAQMLKDANLRKSLLGESRLSKRESQFPSSFENKSIPLRLVFNGSDSPSFANSGPRDFDGSPRTNMSRLVHNLDFFRNVLIPVPLSDSVEMIEKPPKSCMCPEILVADDDMFNLFTMETLFANFNIQIAKAIHGQQAIDMILKRGQAKCGDECKPFKLIFMDVSMPVMDGFETTLKLKEMMKNREILETPIIACTAFVEEEKVAKCFECGMEEKVSKPVSQNKLAEILKRYKIIEKIEI